MIKVGSIEYYALIDLRDNLNKREYNSLGLLNLDRLKFEVQQTIDSIHTPSSQGEVKGDLEGDIATKLSDSPD
jgi:hypothetical protein